MTCSPEGKVSQKRYSFHCVYRSRRVKSINSFTAIDIYDVNSSIMLVVNKSLMPNSPVSDGTITYSQRSQQGGYLQTMQIYISVPQQHYGNARAFKKKTPGSSGSGWPQTTASSVDFPPSPNWNVRLSSSRSSIPKIKVRMFININI